MKIWIAQINTVSGNVEENVKKIDKVIEYLWGKSDVIVFPELTISGSPLYDLNNNAELAEKQKKALEHIKSTVDKIKKDLIVIVWFIDMQWSKMGIFYDSAAIIGR